MSKSRNHWQWWQRQQAACNRKKPYADKRAALSEINLFQDKRGSHGRPEALRAYACPVCRKWHLTKDKE